MKSWWRNCRINSYISLWCRHPVDVFRIMKHYKNFSFGQTRLQVYNWAIVACLVEGLSVPSTRLSVESLYAWCFHQAALYSSNSFDLFWVGALFRVWLRHLRFWGIFFLWFCICISRRLTTQTFAMTASFQVFNSSSFTSARVLCRTVWCKVLFRSLPISDVGLMWIVRIILEVCVRACRHMVWVCVCVCMKSGENWFLWAVRHCNKHGQLGHSFEYHKSGGSCHGSGRKQMCVILKIWAVFSPLCTIII